MAIFLAPRSGEQSSENFRKTIEGGYKKSDVENLLSDADKDKLGDILYVWGNRPGNKSPWEKMQTGDYIFFYQKGFITYVGQLLHKTHNKALADSLWGIEQDTGESWEYVFFITNIIRTQIDYTLLKEYAGYKEKAVVQGFQSYNSTGEDEIIENYGSIENFINDFKAGASAFEITLLDNIAKKSDDETTAQDLEAIDEITNKDEIESLLAQLMDRNKNLEPQMIETRLSKIKRDVLIVRKLKDLYGNKCQICGLIIQKTDGTRYSEVAHIKALFDKGADNITNMLVLCPNHHKMLDFGNLKIDLVSKEALIGKEIFKLNNKHL